MKKLNLLLLAFLVVMGVTLQSCDDSDGYSLGDVAVDWATVNVKGAHVYDFTGDRWGQIWPATTDYFWYSPIDGQRVILYFNPLYDNYPEGYDCSVKVLNIKEILTNPHITFKYIYRIISKLFFILCCQLLYRFS